MQKIFSILVPILLVLYVLWDLSFIAQAKDDKVEVKDVSETKNQITQADFWRSVEAFGNLIDQPLRPPGPACADKGTDLYLASNELANLITSLEKKYPMRWTKEYTLTDLARLVASRWKFPLRYEKDSHANMIQAKRSFNQTLLNLERCLLKQ